MILVACQKKDLYVRIVNSYVYNLCISLSVYIWKEILHIKLHYV